MQNYVSHLSGGVVTKDVFDYNLSGYAIFINCNGNSITECCDCKCN